MTPERYKKILYLLEHRQPDLTIVMEDVHKAHNLAAIARTADAVGIPEIHAISQLEKINLRQDAASGSGRWVHVNIHRNIKSVYSMLRDKGFKLMTAHFSIDAIDYREYDYTQPTAIIVGQELEGITTEAVQNADGSLIIPMYGMIQSLNVSVAAAIILYEALKQREKSGHYKKNKLSEAEIKKFIFEKGYPRLSEFLRSKGEKYPELDENGQIIK